MTKPMGGKRPGAGRHSLYTSPLQKETFRLAVSHIETLKEIDPSLSAAVRVIMDDPTIKGNILKLIKRRNANTNQEKPL